jgi:hypothetical protein
VVGAPRSKGITLDGEYVVDPPLAGCTTTCVAAMVVPSTVPSTSTALAEVGLVPLMVTF